MENEPNIKRPSNRFILLILCLLLAVVIVLIVIVFITMQSPTPVPEETQMNITEAPTNTPIPTITPVETEVPVVTVPVTVEPSPSPTPTATPEGDVVWVNLEYLVIRKAKDFSEPKIGHFTYGEMVLGEIEDNKWMRITYNGETAYIYAGKMKDSGRPCVVSSEADLEPLD